MILYRYILRNHAGPFLFSIITLMFIFLFNFLTKFADRLVGKGLGMWVITKLIVYNLAWMVVLVVPMSVLVATLMAYGNMSNNNEVAIMKASGISIYKMMLPPFLVSIVLAVLLIFFNNRIYPDANHAARLLMHDISNKKPTLSLVPGLFSQEVPNYSILVRSIDENTNMLGGVTLYDYSDPAKLNIVTAKKGRLYFSEDQSKLIMDLNSGEIHESQAQGSQLYRKLIFEKHRIIMDAEQFSFQQSNPGVSRGDRELGAPEMMLIVDSLESEHKRIAGRLIKDLDRLILSDLQLSFSGRSATGQAARPEITSGAERSAEAEAAAENVLRPPVIRPGHPGNLITPGINPDAQNPAAGSSVYERVRQRIAAAQSVLTSDEESIRSSRENINSYLVEVHKKYSLPAACIIFVLIGAPLGIMTRKGGMGVAAGISILFFLVYWAFLIGGEKLADRGLLSPFWGMWSANFVLGILGIYVTVKSGREAITLDFSWIQKLIPQQWRNQQEEDEDN